MPEPDTAIPILEETAEIGVRTVESDRVVVHVTVSERDEAIEALLMRQDVEIERVAIGTVVDTPPAMRREGDVIIVPVLEEVLVTETRLVLREELRIRIGETRRSETQVVRLRREHAEIKRQGDTT